MTLLTPEQITEAARRYAKGAKLLDLCDDYGCGYTHLCTCLRNHGVTFRTAGRSKRDDGNAQRQERMSKPLEGFNPLANDWAKRPLMVSV